MFTFFALVRTEKTWLQAISKMCVFMYVGENDEHMWHSEMKKEADSLASRTSASSKCYGQ